MSDRPLILIDGVCSLCHRVARFILARERSAVARFAALQTPTGRRTLREHDYPSDSLDTMIFIDEGRVYTKSDAALRIARLLRAPWCWAWALRIIPRPIRNWFYDLVARRRYRMWGKEDACMLPSAALRERFIDANEMSA